ncbi:MAG: radical SAM protein [Bryobacteraceae bacterium]
MESEDWGRKNPDVDRPTCYALSLGITPPRRAKPTHHVLEDILARPFVQRALGKLSRQDAGGVSLFERISKNYNNSNLSIAERLKWGFPSLLIDLALKRAKLDREFVTAKLFHHQPTTRALALTGRSIARYGLSAPQRFAAPLMVVWNLTQACNLRCQHCYQNATPQRDACELTLDEKLDVIDQLGAAGVPFLAIAGGEPLVSKDLWSVLERARERRIHVSLATNGTLLSTQNVERLLEAGVKYLEVSIDSIWPDEHDKFRGLPGAWSRSIQGIRNSVAGGMRTGFATCFTRQTVETVDKAIEFAISLGCSTFSHFNFIPVGRGKEMIEEDLTPTQREWLMRKLVDHLQQGRIGIISTAPQFGRSCVAYAPTDGVFATGHAGSGKGRKTMVLSRYVGGCGSGRCYCAIQPNGDVTPCVYMPSLRVGSFRRQSFAEIWECDLFGVLSDRRDRRDHCVECADKAYCGGCRARSLAYLNDVRAGDPGCKNNADLWAELSSGSQLPVLAASRAPDSAIRDSS